MIALNLNEMLIYADFQHINNIVDHYHCQCDRHSKTDMVQAILFKLLRKDTLREIILQADREDLTFIQLLYLDSRTKYTIEDLLAKAKQALDLHQMDRKPRELVLSGLKKGWIFQGVGKKNALVYLVPEDFKNRILETIHQKAKEELNRADDVPFYRDETDLILSDLHIFLSYVKNEEILLTSEGNIYKRQQQLLFRLLHIKEEIIKKQAWRFGYGRRYNEYPDRFSLIYDYAYYFKLTEESANGYLQLTSNGEKWLHEISPSKEKMNLYRFWLRLYKYPISFLPLIVKYIDLVAYKEWVQLDQLERKLMFWIKEHYYETTEIVFQERIIKMLHHLGVLKIGNIEHNVYIRVTDEGHHWINGIEGFHVKEINITK